MREGNLLLYPVINGVIAMLLTDRQRQSSASALPRRRFVVLPADNTDIRRNAGSWSVTSRCGVIVARQS